jgi:hypothetical protein
VNGTLPPEQIGPNGRRRFKNLRTVIKLYPAGYAEPRHALTGNARLKLRVRLQLPVYVPCLVCTEIEFSLKFHEETKGAHYRLVAVHGCKIEKPASFKKSNTSFIFSASILDFPIQNDF